MHKQQQRDVVVRWMVAASAGLALAVVIPIGSVSAEVTDDSDQTQAKIEKLIAELGSAEFRVREAADEQLLAMGLTAYEALQLVADHHDIEIRLRARRIVSALRGRFLTDGVAEVLVPMLEGYHEKATDERRQLMLELAELLPHQAADALTRLARFEEDEALSRAAAQALLEVPLANRIDLSQMIREMETAIGYSDRAAVGWLRAYCQSFHKDPAAVGAWKELIEQEATRDLALEETESDRQSDLALLLRVASSAAEFAGNSTVAGDYRRELTAQIDTPIEHEQWLRWLLDRSSWSAIMEFSESHAAGFADQPVMLYGLAEAQAALGNEEAAQATAAQALAVNQNASAEHYVMAVWLKSVRGLYDWAEAEYRVAIEACEVASAEYFRAHKWLAEMLHDLGRDGEAADLREEVLALVSVTDEVKKDKAKQQEYRRRLQALDQSGDSEPELRTRAILFRALHYRALGERENELAELLQGGKFAGDDVDLLIAMFNSEDPPPELREMTSAGIKQAAATYQREIRDFSAHLEREQGPGRATFRLGLATSLNQYAWLVGNTEGDIQEAIQNSHRSLRLRMGEGGYLDTLARCYYRNGQLDQALKYQQMAVERAPHELQIQRQLQLFKNALAERQTTGGAGSAPD